MASRSQLYQTFAQALGIELGQVQDSLTYNTIPQWDSVAHMALVAALESAFNIMLDTDDIIDMSSVGKAASILEKYDIRWEN